MSFRLSRENREIAVAAALGLLALIVNLIASRGFTTISFRPGTIVIYIAAIAFGMRGALLALFTGSIPELLLMKHVPFFVQHAGLAIVLGYTSQSYPKIPAFVVGVGFWCFILTPIFVFGSGLAPGSDPIWGFNLGFLALTDLLYVLYAGLTLMVPDIYTFLTRRPCHRSASSLLAHICAALANTSVFVTLVFAAFAGGGLKALPFLNHGGGLLLFTIAVTILAAIAGWRLTHIFGDSRLSVSQSGLMASSRSFSGLASDYWRREQITEGSLPLSVTHGGLGSANGQSPEIPKSPLNDPEKGICALNRDGSVIFANRKFRQLGNIRLNNPVGKRLDALDMPKPLCEHLLQLLETTIAHGPRVTEFKLVQQDDSLAYFEIGSMLAAEIENSTVSGGPDSIIVTIRDITERRTVEFYLLHSQRLAGLGQILQRTGATFADLLCQVLTRAGLLRKAGGSDSSGPALEKIERCAREASQLIRQLLRYSGGASRSYETVDLPQFLQSNSGILEGAAGADFKLELPADGGKHLHARIEPNLLTQALINLITNAREAYSSPGGVIALQLGEEQIEEEVSLLHLGARAGKFARIRVQDNGQGMTAEQLEKAFEPLETTKLRQGHAGLGLSIVYAIIRAHDGFLTMESRPERGTTVSLYLPVAEAPAREQVLSSQPSVAAGIDQSSLCRGSGQQLHLIAEDDAMRTFLSEVLSDVGYSVRSFKNASDCPAPGANNVGYIVDLPFHDEALKVAVEATASLPADKVLYLAAREVSSIPASRQAAVLRKPFDAERLLLRVSKIVEISPPRSSGTNAAAPASAAEK